MGIYKSINKKNFYVILIVFAAALIVRPVEGQSNPDNPVIEAQSEPKIFLPIVSAPPPEVDFAARPNEQDSPGYHNRIHHHKNEHRNRSRFAALGGVWPPQPKSMRNIVVNRSDKAMARMEALNAKGKAARDHEIVQRALGERFAYIGTEDLASKVRPDRIDVKNTYFSHTNNQMVEVMVDQDRVVDVLVVPANEYQPPLAPTEREEAIAIAHAYFKEAGFSRIATLEGFAIRAFPPNGEGVYYNNRMAYISFHADGDSPPEYVAWVDLTEQVVVKGREE